MLIIGCDYHPGFQQIAFVDTETGEYRKEAEEFYNPLKERKVRGCINGSRTRAGT
jgi:hypothetical protein